jgi:hypothetical protein
MATLTHKGEIKMAVKKVEKRFHARITKNTDKGGSWLTMIRLSTTLADEVDTYTAWSNPSAAKRFIKAKVLEVTGRKSIKMNVVKMDDNGKPTLITGDLIYKVAE